MNWALALDHSTLDEPALRVGSIMSKGALSCLASDSVNVAAHIMWNNDCGCVPVVDRPGHLVGMITDRDISMAAYTQGKTLNEISVASACSGRLYTCRTDELVWDAARTMVRAQVRRLPVVDADGQLVGILTLSDLVRNLWFAGSLAGIAEGARRIISLLEAVSRPRPESTDNLAPMSESERAYFAEFDAP